MAYLVSDNWGGVLCAPAGATEWDPHGLHSLLESENMWAKCFAIIRVILIAKEKNSLLNISIGFNRKICLDMWNLPHWNKLLKIDSFLYHPPAAWFFIILICERKDFFQVIMWRCVTNKIHVFLALSLMSINCVLDAI